VTSFWLGLRIINSVNRYLCYRPNNAYATMFLTNLLSGQPHKSSQTYDVFKEWKKVRNKSNR